MTTTARSGTDRIRDGIKVNSNLTFSHGQYLAASQPGGPWTGCISSQMNPVGFGVAASRASLVALSTHGNCSVSSSFRLMNKHELKNKREKLNINTKYD